MKAVILVGGEGTRLRPLTCTLPKPMVPLVNRAFLEHMIDWLRGHGFDEVVLALFYLPDRIQSHFGDGAAFGVKLSYVVEPMPLGTAGAVKNVAHLIDDTFAVFNGDILTDLDLTAMLAHHRERGAKVTIALTPVEDPTQYGVVEMNAEGRVLRFIEKPSWDAVTTNLINAGTYIMEPETLAGVPANTYYMFERGLFPSLLAAGEPVFGYAADNYWIDIGTPDKYLTANHDLLMGRASSRLVEAMTSHAVAIPPDCNVSASARLSGPTVLGGGCAIGRNVHITGPTVVGDRCTIGAGTVIEDSVIWPNSFIGENVVMRRCVVGANCVIGNGVWLMDGTVIGDNANIGPGNKLDHGIRIWAGRTLEPETISF